MKKFIKRHKFLSAAHQEKAAYDQSSNEPNYARAIHALI